jgi:thiamine-phosphate pyrophosphorylase
VGGPLRLPPLYAIIDADTAALAGWTVPALARAMLDGGARLLQVRAKAASPAALLNLSEAVVALARPYGATVIVNDRADIASLSGADGVHLGQDDLPVQAARSAFPGLAMVGLSTHTRAEVEAAAEAAPDYVAVGPVFGTSTKATGCGAVGLELVRHAAGVHGGGGDRRPVVAIGGITLARARQVLDAGAASVAVISDLMTSGNPADRVRRFLEALRG